MAFPWGRCKVHHHVPVPGPPASWPPPRILVPDRCGPRRRLRFPPPLGIICRAGMDSTCSTFFQSGGGTGEVPGGGLPADRRSGIQLPSHPHRLPDLHPVRQWTNFSETTLRELDRAVSFGPDPWDPCLPESTSDPRVHRMRPRPRRAILFTDPEVQQVAEALGHQRNGMPGHPQMRTSVSICSTSPRHHARVPTPMSWPSSAAIRGWIRLSHHCRRPGLRAGAGSRVDPVEGGAGHPRLYSFALTHYRASWVAGSDQWSEPQWPSPLVPNFLYGPVKPRVPEHPESQDHAVRSHPLWDPGHAGVRSIPPRHSRQRSVGPGTTSSSPGPGRVSGRRWSMCRSTGSTKTDTTGTTHGNTARGHDDRLHRQHGGRLDDVS